MVQPSGLEPPDQTAPPRSRESVLVAIPVHDRPRLVAHCLATATALVLPPGSEILVIDDASTDPAIPALLAGVATRTRQLRRDRSTGAGGAIVDVWTRFLAGPHQALFCLDSDMIANRTAVVDGLAVLSGFAGLLSLYNSTMHPDLGPVSGPRVAKPRLGNAGTLWTRRLVELVAAEIPAGPRIDHRYSELLARRGIPMAATTRSRVQHLGIEGSNNRYFGMIDYGIGFVPDSAEQSRALAETLDLLLGNQAYYLRPPLWRRALRRLLRPTGPG